MNKINQNNPAKVFFPNLDGLRTIAFLLVYIQHGFWGSFELLEIKNDFLNRFVFDVANGGTGVSVFFVLSGFLITYLILSEIDIIGKVNVLYFYIRRVLRIWPLYYVVMIFAFVIYPFLKHLIGIESNLASKPFYYFTFFSNFDVLNIEKVHPGSNAAIQGISWSVSVEEQFYLVWPLLFLLVSKRFYKWIFPSIIVVSLFFRFINRNDPYTLYFHSFSVCADLAVGGVCAYFALYSEKFKQFIQNLPKFAITLIYITGFTWLLYGGEVLDSFTKPVLFRLVSTLFFVFVILEQNFSKCSFYKFSKFKVLTYWGKYTYGLYLLHPIALLILDVTLRVLNIDYSKTLLPSLMVGFAGLGLSLVLSYISYEYFEKRFLKLKDRFSIIRKGTPKRNTIIKTEEEVFI